MNNFFLTKYHNILNKINLTWSNQSFFDNNINSLSIKTTEIISEIIKNKVDFPSTDYSEKTELKQTEQLGLGLFAGDHIPANSFIGEYTGKIRPDYKYSPGSYAMMYAPITIKGLSDLLNIAKLTTHSSFLKKHIEKYLNLSKGSLDKLKIAEHIIKNSPQSNLVIDAMEHGNHTRFINHSNKPNLKATHIYHENKWKALLFSVKDIPKGEQLFFNYGKDYWKGKKKPL